MDLFYELEFDNNDLLEVINEKSNQKDIYKYSQAPIKLMFEHMIKWQYNKPKQSESWLESIILKGYNELFDLGLKEVAKYVNNDDLLDQLYKIGRAHAVTEDRKNNNSDIINKNVPKTRPYEWDINFLTSAEKIKNFLEFHYNRSNKYDVDLDGYLNKMSK